VIPSEYSSGGQQRLGGLSKQGNPTIAAERHDRADHLALPHRREVGRRREQIVECGSKPGVRRERGRTMKQLLYFGAMLSLMMSVQVSAQTSF
jgi:hypothetical protein